MQAVQADAGDTALVVDKSSQSFLWTRLMVSVEIVSERGHQWLHGLKSDLHADLHYFRFTIRFYLRRLSVKLNFLLKVISSDLIVECARV